MKETPDYFEFDCFACGSGCNGNYIECDCLNDPECEDCDGTFWLNADVPMCKACLAESEEEEKADEYRKENN